MSGAGGRTLEAGFEVRRSIDAAVADSAQRVPGGLLLRSDRFPHSRDLNQLALDPGASAEALRRAVALAEDPARGGAVRRITVPAPRDGVAVPGGWTAVELVAMAFDGPRPPRPDGVAEVAPGSLRAARARMWADEGAPDIAGELLELQVAFGEHPGTRTLAVLEEGEPVAWATEAHGCVEDVWVVPERRGHGLGRRVTLAAMACGGRQLTAEAGDPRARGLYRSLGWEDAGRVLVLVRGAR